MSYILDALKKSEGEREQEQLSGQVPDWQTDHSGYTVSDAPTKQQIYTISIMSAILVSMLLGILIWWLDTKGIRSEAPPSVSVTPTTTVPATVPESVVPAEDKPSRASSSSDSTSKVTTKTTFEKFNQVQNSALSQTKNKAAVQAGSESAKSEEKGQKGSVIFSDELLDGKSAAETPSEKVLEVKDIPVSIRAKIPAINFSGHVYSNEAKQRSIMVNGRKTQEGQVVDKDLVVEKITTDGAIFNYKGWRFRLGALQDWSYSSKN